MVRKASLILCAVLALAAGLLPATPAWAASRSQAAQMALDWLKTQQNPDGGFGSGFTPGSNPGTTADAILAITSAGQDASLWRVAGKSPLDYLHIQSRSGAIRTPGLAAKIILAAVAVGLGPKEFGNWSLVRVIDKAYNLETGLYSPSIYEHALVILARVNAAQPVPQKAIDALMAAQTSDGSWNFAGNRAPTSADTNTTAMAMLALVATGHRDRLDPAITYYRREENPDAGWAYQKPSPYGEATDAESTAMVIQALLAAGEDVRVTYYRNGSDPWGTLIGMQQPSGAISFEKAFPSDNIVATIQAIPALVGATFVTVHRVPARYP